MYSIQKILFSLLFVVCTQYAFSQATTYVYGSLGMSPNATMGVFGDLVSFDDRVILAGEVQLNTVASKVKSPGLIYINRLIFNMQESVQVETELGVTGYAEFNSGVVYSDRSQLDKYFLHFLESATYTGLSNTTYVDGTVAKSGSDAFVYPIGHNFNVSTLTMTAPTDVNSFYKAYFLEDNVATVLSTATSGICANDLSKKGYWLFNKALASSNDVIVTLNYDPGMLLVDDACLNVIASFNESTMQWDSEGNGGATGDNALGGDITSGTGCLECGTEQEVNQYTFLTIASNIETLDVDFISFDGIWVNKNEAELTWKVSKEQDNDYFVLERSEDGINWDELKTIESLGDFEGEREYKYIDDSAYASRLYYRIKEVDLNGAEEYYNEIILLTKDASQVEKLVAYPNPVVNNLFVEFPEQYEGMTINVYNMAGQIEFIQENIQSPQSLHFANLAQGYYIIQFVNPTSGLIEKTITIQKQNNLQ